MWSIPPPPTPPACTERSARHDLSEREPATTLQQRRGPGRGRLRIRFTGQIQPPTEQTNVLAKFTKALADGWSLTFTGSVFNSQAEQVAPETPPFGHALNQTRG